MMETTNNFTKTYLLLVLVQIQLCLCFYLYHHLYYTIKEDIDDRLILLNAENKNNIKLDGKTIQCLNEVCKNYNSLDLDMHPVERMKIYHSIKKRESSNCGVPGPSGPPGPRGLPGQKGEPGAQGFPGIIGAPGMTGPKGYFGPRGLPGEKGKEGQFGIPGPPGISGRRGEPGEKGIKGDIGIEGPPGYPGPRGTPGLIGNSGPPGPVGLTGPKGEVGFQGIQGVTGLRGAIGPKGERGEKGLTGVPGVTGSVGVPGLRGIPGDQGQRGEKGDTGETGTQGISGANGRTGLQGEKGQKGDNGQVGFPGTVGLPGPKGFQGPEGPPGIPGPKGETGFQGPPGFNGSPGPKGSQGIRGIRGPRGKQGLPGRCCKNTSQNPKIEKYGEKAYDDLPERNLSCILFRPEFEEYKKVNDKSNGQWLADLKPINEEEKQKRWIINYDDYVLEEYLNEELLLLNEIDKYDKHPGNNRALNSNFRSYDLFLLVDGNGNIIYQGQLFSIVSPKRPAVIKYFLNNQTNQILTIPELASSRVHTLYKDKSNYFDFAVDDQGTWIIFSVPSSNNTGIIKFNTNSLNIEYIWNITLNHKDFNKMFIAHGVLYCLVVENERIEIPLAIDLYQNQFYDTNIVLSKPAKDITAFYYNHHTYELILWSNDYRWTMNFQCIDLQSVADEVPVE